MTEQIQCDGCDEHKPERKIEFEHLPGATLAWCESCREPTKEEMYL